MKTHVKLFVKLHASALDGMLHYVGKVFLQLRLSSIVSTSNLFVLYLEERERERGKERFGHKQSSVLQKCL